MIAGCKILNGNIDKDYLYQIIREENIVEKDLEISNLKHFKKEV